jgi:hypothetical protein
VTVVKVDGPISPLDNPGMRRTLALVSMAAALLAARTGHAQPRTDYTPSIFAYGFDGFLLGGGTGLCAGYLAGRSGGWHKDDWQSLAYGAGFGALGGGLLGISLGITDMINETPGRGYYVLRDGGMGLGFGIATGAIAGGLAATGSKKPEHILLGAAIGGLVGTGVGVALGIVEGQRMGPRRNVALTIAPAPTAAGRLAWMPALVGRY